MDAAPPAPAWRGPRPRSSRRRGWAPRCAVCRVTIQPGVNVVFRLDGRVHHAECPRVLCAFCSRDIRPADPIRREGEAMVHANCWVKRHRAHPVTAGEDVRALIRSRLAAGTLPCLTPTMVWGGEGDGERCAACDKTIDRSQSEVEFAGTVTVHFHVVCFTIWEQERVKQPQREINGGSGDSAWTLVFERRLAARASWDRVAFDEMRIVTQELRYSSAGLCARARATCRAHRRLA